MNHRLLVAVLFLHLLPAPAQSDIAPHVPNATVPTVPVSQPVRREVTDFESFLGRTQAVQSVDLRARATGYLVRVHFRDGAEVRQDELLFEIDPRPYQVELDRARAGLARAQARLHLAEASVRRARALAGTNALTKEALDKVEAERTEAETVVRLARSDSELAQLQLSFTKVTAPISGHIGRRLLDVGNLVKADETLLATVVSQDPMYAYFEVDESTLLRIRRAANAGQIKMPKAGKAPVYLGLPGEDGYPHAGTLDFINNQVNPTTGSITVRGILPNPRPTGGVRLFSPGMFVRARLPLGAPHPALLVSEAAIGSDQGLKYVYVLDAKNVIRYRRVQWGQLQDDGLRVITNGLKAEEWIVVGGMQRVRPGLMVRPERVLMPAARPAADQGAPAPLKQRPPKEG